MDRAVPLNKLVKALPKAHVIGNYNGDTVVTGISADTREMKPGSIFVALPGFHVDGKKFIPNAIEKGAKAVVVEGSYQPDLQVPVIIVDNARLAFSRLAAEFWDNPSHKLKVIGVTGTNGKTTTTYMISSVLESADVSTGFITTVDYKIANHQWKHEEHSTTPQPDRLHELLYRMLQAGVEYAVIESSSHGLKLHRLEDVAYDVAVFTNVTSEHLELHGTVEQYRLDKARLFQLLGNHPDKGCGKWGVINLDDPNAQLYIDSTKGKVFTYSQQDENADLIGNIIPRSEEGVTFRVHYKGNSTEINLPISGDYNVYNALAAIGVAITQNIPIDVCKSALERFTGVPGRMQVISMGQPFTVVIDYAHTEDSLEKVLITLKQRTRGRLFAVFGSAGERDPYKRAPMGKVAAKYADFMILTNEDPRGEDEMQILLDIAEGARSVGAIEGRDYICIPDRKAAIYEALSRASGGDTVLLAGKGHETTIETKNGFIPWDEAEIAKQALKDLGYTGK